MSLARKVRITILLYVLLLVAVGTWLAGSRTTDWDETLWVTVHPIAADGDEQQHVEQDRDPDLAGQRHRCLPGVGARRRAARPGSGPANCRR